MNVNIFLIVIYTVIVMLGLGFGIFVLYKVLKKLMK